MHPGITAMRRELPTLRRELQDLKGGSHLSMVRRRPPSSFGNPEPQMGGPNFPALGRDPYTKGKAPPSGRGPQHWGERPLQYFGNPMHHKEVPSPLHWRGRPLCYFVNPSLRSGSSPPHPADRVYLLRQEKSEHVPSLIGRTQKRERLKTLEVGEEG